MQLLDRVDRIEGRPSSLSSPSGLREGPGARGHEPTDDEDAPFAPVSAAPPARQQLADLELADEEPSAADAATDLAQLDSPTIDESREVQQGAPSAPADLVSAHAFDSDPTFEKLALGSASTVPTRPPGAAPGSAAIDTPPIRPARRRRRDQTDVRPGRAAQRRPGQRRSAAVYSRVKSPRHVTAAAAAALAVLAVVSILGVGAGHGRARAHAAPAVTDAASIGAKPMVETKRTAAPTTTTRKRHKQAAHRTNHRPQHRRYQKSTPRRRTHAATPVHYAVAASTTVTPSSAPTQTAPTQTTPTQTTPTVTTPASPAPAAPSSPSSPGPSSSGSSTSSGSGTSSSGSVKQPAFGLRGELGPGHSPNS